MPTDTKEELKPCPFCGSAPVVYSKFHYVGCKNIKCVCLPMTWLMHSDEEAIEAWNRRWPDADRHDRET